MSDVVKDRIAWRRLHHVCDGQAVAGAFEERPGVLPRAARLRQVGGALTGEWTVAMPSHDGWIPEQTGRT